LIRWQQTIAVWGYKCLLFNSIAYDIDWWSSGRNTCRLLLNFIRHRRDICTFTVDQKREERQTTKYSSSFFLFVFFKSLDTLFVWVTIHTYNDPSSPCSIACTQRAICRAMWLTGSIDNRYDEDEMAWMNCVDTQDSKDDNARQ